MQRHNISIGKCCVCWLPLKDEKSLEIGMGPFCKKKFQEKISNLTSRQTSNNNNNDDDDNNDNNNNVSTSVAATKKAKKESI
jgi:hypothetical protein